MAIEYQTTMTDLAAIDMNQFSADNTIPTPPAPAGSGWILNQVTAGQRKIYYVWQRGSSVVTLNSNYTVQPTDENLLVDSSQQAITITLPSSMSGSKVTIKKIDSSSNSVNVLPPNGKTIDGATQKNITVQYNALSIVTDGNNWFIV